MLAIARGLMARPEVLMLDEPSLGLAPKLLEILYDLLADLREEGTTILLVDQMAALALSVADRAYVLQSGTITHSGTAAKSPRSGARCRPISASAVNKDLTTEETWNMDLILRNARSSGAEHALTDIGIAGGRIATIAARSCGRRRNH